jgi:hypothetical protein
MTKYSGPKGSIGPVGFPGPMGPGGPDSKPMTLLEAAHSHMRAILPTYLAGEISFEKLIAYEMAILCFIKDNKHRIHEDFTEDEIYFNYIRLS